MARKFEKKTEPVDGHGRFNRSGTPAYAKRLVDKAYKAVQPDISSKEDWTHISETVMAAWETSQPQPKTSAPNPAWELSWEDREKFVSAVKYSSTVKTAEDVAEKQKILAMFGKSALIPEEYTIACMGEEMFGYVKEFMSSTGDTSRTLNLGRDPLADTGRYVRLKGGAGEDGKPLKDSQLLMELPPSGDTHRFLDLECEDGKAQVILLPRGSYEIAGEYEKNELIQFGIDAAKKARDNGALSVRSEVDIPNYGPADPACYDTFDASRSSGPEHGGYGTVPFTIAPGHDSHGFPILDDALMGPAEAARRMPPSRQTEDLAASGVDGARPENPPRKGMSAYDRLVAEVAKRDGRDSDRDHGDGGHGVGPSLGA